MLKKLFLAGMIMGLIYSAATGAEEEKTSFPGIGFAVMKDRLVLDEKGDDYVMCCKRRFDITSYTLIKNERGMIISLDQLEVPSEAIVSYYEKPGKKRHYVVVSLEVKGEPQLTPE